jgi:hypothetical protein
MSNYLLSTNTPLSKVTAGYEAYDEMFSNDGFPSTTFCKATSNRLFFDTPSAPIFTSDASFDSLNYDQTNSTYAQTFTTNGTFKNVSSTKHGLDAPLLKGKRDGAPQFLSTAY